ncbi:hypothetical protein E1263_32820 [Kribbella antibiotica]|uniref:DUF4352 domain-containing protein n=1 Tax=Kribbella antibiotica TaxID=190195 RepID=A0A4R4YU78_9ACTN|nr:hypothetical protein [Kribbella antibiotica]TDD48843.1 hypothetical protein E1263_32820 [Kribbella antibiotica]
MTRRKLLNAGLTLAVLVAIIGLYRWTPTQKDIQDPTPINGVMARPVDAGRFKLTVDAVRVGKKLKIPRNTTVRETKTNFVVVDATVVATQEPIHLNLVQIRTADGVTYVGANRSGLETVDLGSFQFAPGIAARGSIVIEMPADKLPGATLQVMEKAYMNDLEPQANVSLGDQAPAVRDVVTFAKASAS